MDPKLYFLMVLIGLLSALYHAGASRGSSTRTLEPTTGTQTAALVVAPGRTSAT